MQKTYGIKLKTKPATPLRPVPMTLSTQAVLTAAKRVISTHKDVIEALAKR